MGWEFWESGLEKLHGENWFADIQSRFPFPFDVIPAGFSWQLSTWFELIGAVMLWIGLGTRVFAFVLLFLTFVATAAVHWPSMLTMWSDLAKGYAITDMGHGNFKLPLLFAVMLLPLIFGGARPIQPRSSAGDARRRRDARAAARTPQLGDRRRGARDSVPDADSRAWRRAARRRDRAGASWDRRTQGSARRPRGRPLVAATALRDFPRT